MNAKTKSRKCVAKRLRVKSGGKLKCRRAFRSHCNEKMTAKQSRRLRNNGRYISDHFAKKLREMI